LNLNKTLFVLAAFATLAVGARADDPSMPPPDQAPSAPAAAPASGDQGMAKPDHKGEWKQMLKDACSTEIADGGICAGKDFGTGLDKCLERHRRSEKMSDGCKKAVRKHRRHWMHAHRDNPQDHHDGDADNAPAHDAPAPAPAQ
jgi:hypothetical protein